jgi:hypothetical protein
VLACLGDAGIGEVLREISDGDTAENIAGDARRPCGLLYGHWEGVFSAREDIVALNIVASVPHWIPVGHSVNIDTPGWQRIWL